MNKIKLIIALLFFVPTIVFCQNTSHFSIAKTSTGEIKIPGNWEELNTVEDSGQTYYKNKDGVIIAVAKNPKKAYPFFLKNKSDFENVKLFYVWDSDYMKESKYKTDFIKEDSKSEYVIWKYNAGKFDNVYLFGSIKDTFLNLLVYTNDWTENEKITFLESVYKLNK